MGLGARDFGEQTLLGWFDAQSHDEPARRAVARLRRAFAAGQGFRQRGIPVRAGGAQRWWALTARPLIDEAGQPEGWRGVITDITTEHDAHERALQMATVDSLTGLANRMQLRDRLQAALAGAAQRPAGAPVPEHGSFQAPQRHVRQRLGRPGAARGRATPRPARAPGGRGRALGRRRVRGPDRRRDQRGRGAAPRPGASSAELGRRLREQRRRGDRGQRERGHRPDDPGPRPDGRRAARERRPRAELGQDRRPWPLRDVPRRHGRAPAPAHDARARPAPGRREERAAPALAAAGRDGRLARERLRGAAALAACGDRPRLAGAVHPARGGDRPDRRARRVGAEDQGPAASASSACPG